MREPGVPTGPQTEPRDGRPLYGSTLIASKPAGTLSPTALTVAIVLHVVVFGALLVISKPFSRGDKPTVLENITIIIPEEEPAEITLPVTNTPVAPPKKDEPRRAQPNPATPEAEPELTFTPGPIRELPPVTEGPETVEPTGEGRPSPARSLTERLKPPLLDPRLGSQPTYSLPPDNSPAAGVRARVSQSIAMYNDSMAAEAAARDRGLDWTKTTKDGKRWGIGPDGKIYLGDIVLPKMVAFTPPPGKRDEINARNRDFAEIEAQANREIGRQTFKDRVKAVRARKDREREEKKKAAEDGPITN